MSKTRIITKETPPSSDSSEKNQKPAYQVRAVMPKVYVRCPECNGDSAVYPEDDCQLCDSTGCLSEEGLIERLGLKEAQELLDFYYLRGKFKDFPPHPISPFMKGYDA